MVLISLPIWPIQSNRERSNCIYHLLSPLPFLLIPISLRVIAPSHYLHVALVKVGRRPAWALSWIGNKSSKSISTKKEKRSTMTSQSSHTITRGKLEIITIHICCKRITILLVNQFFLLWRYKAIKVTKSRQLHDLFKNQIW